MERKWKLKELDRSFDLQFWQAQRRAARFAATWDLIVTAWRMQGKDVRELRLQRIRSKLFNENQVEYLVVGGYAVIKPSFCRRPVFVGEPAPSRPWPVRMLRLPPPRRSWSAWRTGNTSVLPSNGGRKVSTPSGEGGGSVVVCAR